MLLLLTIYNLNFLLVKENMYVRVTDRSLFTRRKSKEATKIAYKIIFTLMLTTATIIKLLSGHS